MRCELYWFNCPGTRGRRKHAISYIGGKKRTYIIIHGADLKYRLSFINNDGNYEVQLGSHDCLFDAFAEAYGHVNETLKMYAHQYLPTTEYNNLLFRHVNHSTYVAKICIGSRNRTYRINTKKRYPILEILGYKPIRKERYNDLDAALMGATIEHRMVYGCQNHIIYGSTK